jgi:D-lactate dehydrogenase (cytochrome)
MILDLIQDLQAILSPNQVSSSQSVLEHHSKDESWHPPVLPNVVVFPESHEDVVKIVRYAFEHNLPVVPFGMGSGLEGHVVPVKRGISVDMMRMNRILEVRTDDFLVCVQPGVTRIELNEELKRHGLFFTVDPGANASLGGMTSTNASGTTAVRYGTMKDNVRALEVVLSDGRTIQVGSLAAKSSSGYNLTPLFVGSEGTLGIFTKIWLKVSGVPEATVAARAEFPDIQSSVNTSTAIVGAGVQIARVELVDAPFIDAVNQFKHTAYRVVPTLFLEFRGTEKGIESDVKLVREIATEEGCTAFEFVTSEQERNQLWEARHSAAYAFNHQHPHHGHMATDVCVPLSKLPEAVTRAKRLLTEMGVDGAIIGHVGDGNFHVSLAVKPNDEEDMKRAYKFNESLVYHALSLGGTCTGEHGVGLGKRKYQEKEHGASIEVMRAIKNTLDPHHIMNPGKLIDPIEPSTNPIQ